jgi:hypothetical protein
MPKFTHGLTMPAIGLLAAFCVGACATSPPGPSKEDLLTAAGFKTKLADTPEKMAELKKLPPLKFIQKDHNGKTLTLYADPAGCRCLFFGDQAALQAYHQERFAQHLAEENENAAAEANEAAMLNENAAQWNSFGWGPWGVDGWGPY